MLQRPVRNARRGIVFLPLVALLAFAGTATAETLLVQRAAETAQLGPARGARMADVKARYGAPAETPAPRGGQKRQWPTINRWVYPEFTVYFEKDKVVDVVANKADASEVGPRPAVR